MRNRTIGINVRVSENEKKKLQKNAQKANLKLSSYLRKVGLQQKIYEIPDEELRKIYAGIVELKNEFPYMSNEEIKEKIGNVMQQNRHHTKKEDIVTYNQYIKNRKIKNKIKKFL